MITTLPSLDLPSINATLAAAPPTEIARWAAGTFDNLVCLSSFGAESMCTIHLANTVRPGIKIVFVDTGYLFPETHAFMEQMRRRFNLNVWAYRTRNDPIVWLSVNGEPDPRQRLDVDACCAANKNEPFDRAMKDLAPQAWFRGVRADQSRERSQMHPVEWSRRNPGYAISPILKWTARDIHHYMKAHDLPYHPLWEKGYVSIGCNPITCTRPVGEGEDPRSGRWSSSTKKECGINLDQAGGI